MSRPCLSLLGMAVFFVAITSAFDAPAERESPFRTIPIPNKEHGYSNFDSIVIASKSDLDAFLKEGSMGRGMSWNNRADFEKALNQANVDFSRESLVLLRHTEGSGSIQVNFLTPRVSAKRVICQIDRKVPEVGTADMAYYCLALAVSRPAITEVELQIPGAKSIVLSVNAEKEPNRPDAVDGK